IRSNGSTGLRLSSVHWPTESSPVLEPDTGRTHPPPSVRKPATQRPPYFQELARQIISTINRASHMDDVDSTPMSLQILEHEPPVAMLRGRLGAQQGRRRVEQQPLQLRFD